MPCFSCQRWQKPDRGSGRRSDNLRAMGWCRHDKRPSHPGYHCTHYLAPALREDRLGLTEPEIVWLRAHRTRVREHELITLYRMVCACPRDPGARGLFAAALNAWRAERERSGVSLRLPITDQ